MTRIRINVSGEVFETDIELMREKQFDKLTELHNEAVKVGNTKDVVVNRPPGTFGAILTYFLTGCLHLPPTVCPSVFKQELVFWEIDSGDLQECCQYKLQAFTDEENTRQNFLFKSSTPLSNPVLVPKPDVSMFTRVRAKLWSLIDNNENSIPARLYFGLVFIMVLLSIIGLALSTEPRFRRSLSQCELLDYLDSVDDPELYKVEMYLGSPDCKASSSYWFDPPEDPEDNQLNTDKTSNKLPPGANAPNGANTVTSAKPDHSQSATNWTEHPEDIPPYTDLTSMVYEQFPKLPRLTIPVRAFYILDFLVVVFFSTDLLLRLISCPSLKKYFLSPVNVLDALALLSCYVYIIIVSVNHELRYVNSMWLFLLDFSQIFRVLRLFRIVKNVRASRVLAYSLTQNLRDMSLLAMLLIIAISVFANLFYFAEDRETVRSIPVAWYWAIITMTTVGYGDIHPISILGHILAILCAISGVLLLALTLPMFVNNFMCLYKYSCVNDSIKKNKVSKEKICPIKSSEKSIVREHLEEVDVKSTSIFVKSKE